MILFADDEEMLRVTIQTYLETLNYRVLLASNGQECIDIFKEHHQEIDLLLLDINMPIKNGVDVIKVVSKISNKPKIIVSTGYPGEQSGLDKVQDKVSKILEKPYALNRLAQEIESVLSYLDNS